MEEIKKEQLKDLFERAEFLYKQKNNIEPDYIGFNEDGMVVCYDRDYEGYIDSTSYSLEEVYENSDSIIQKAIEEKREAIKRAEEQRKANELWQKQVIERQEKEMYERLKAKYGK
jgi:hypothetical protein